MAFTACQNDEGVKNSVNGEEGIVNFTVNAPELATRVTDGDGQYGFDSAYGAIDYADNSYSFLQSEYDIRWQMEIYEANALDAEPIYTERLVHSTDYAPYTSFTGIRLVPGREYQFVIFADFVEQGSLEDFRYNTADLKNITADSELNAMDETYDAYFVSKTFKVEAGTVNDFEATLTRPFGKIRVLTTDADFVANYAVPAKGQVTFYNHPIYKSFNAVTGLVDTELTNEEEFVEYAIDAAYYAGTTFKGAPATTLFATYVLGKDAQETVNFRMDTFEEDGNLIKSNDFSTEIPYQRNHLTTIVGTLLTNEANVFIEIDDNFDVEHVEEGEWDNPEAEIAYVREGVQVAGDVYDYETNLFNIRLLSDNGAQALPVGKFDYTTETIMVQNGYGFQLFGGNVENIEKGTLVIEEAGSGYALKLDIYATIDGVTENYIYEWAGELKAPRTPLAEPVVTYEFDEEATHITFSWEAVEGAKSYTVEYNGEEQTVEGTAATFEFTYTAQPGQLVVNQTAYVTANPEFTWSNTESKATVNVEYEIPIVYTEVPVKLAYVDGTEVAFYAEGLNIWVPKYPTLEDAWYQAEGETPKVFSGSATLEETTGSAAGVVISDPVIATKFVYTGAMNPYVLTEANVNWTDGANTVAVEFANAAGDAITIHTALEAGEFTVEPSYVAVAGAAVPVNTLKGVTMNVMLDNGVYTVFFNIEAANNTVLMQYVGAIDFTKPYTPDFKLTTCTAGENTINFTGDVEFEIEGTSLESGEVVVTKYVVAGTDFVAEGAKVTAVATVTEENGVYDARYVVTTDMVITTQVKNLQYVGEFKPYEAPAEPVYEALTTLSDNEYYHPNKYGYQWHFVSETGYYGDFFINNGKNTSELVEGEYAWHSMYADMNTPGFTVTMRDANKALVTVTSASLKVEGNVVYLTVNEIYFKGEIATVEPEPEPDQPTYEELNLTATYETLVGSVKAYHAEPYWISGDTWMEGNPLTGIKQEGTIESTETNGNVTTFKFTDEVNFKKVTVTYTDETAPSFDPWTFGASLNTGTRILTLTDAAGNIVTAKLNGKYGLSAGTYYINDTTGVLYATDITVNGTAATTVSGTITLANNTYKISLDMTVDGVKYSGTSTNSAL